MAWSGVALSLAIIGAYSRTLTVPFLMDDPSSIVTNPSIQHLWPPWTIFVPPPLLTVSGRPLVNASLAVNYAISGTAPWSYHVVNVLIHIGAALLLYGIVRRTLLAMRPAGPSREGAGWIAWAVAACWALHPLQTESVTYVIQRAESLMGLGFLAAIYAFIRGAEEKSWGWLMGSVLAGWAAMASKEVAAAAPLVIALYDRTFVAGSFKAAWRERNKYYLALATGWILLAALIAGAKGRGGTAGFTTDVSSWHYLLTQTKALWLYLRLSAWPDPLIFDYGIAVVKSPGEAAVSGLGMVGLAGLTAWALWRRPALGFAGACFFLILAPTSSVVPVATQTIAEHRMYLPLAAALAVAVVGGQAWLGRRAGWLLAGVAVALGVVTWQRNELYRDDLALWQQTVNRRPNNARAHYNVAVLLGERGKKAETMTAYEAALTLDPAFAEAHGNLGGVLASVGRQEEALFHYEAAAKIDPDNPESHNSLAFALVQAGRIPEALPHYAEALRLRPDYPEAHNNLGGALAQQGRPAEALPEIHEALRLRPNYAEAHGNLGSALLQLGQVVEATRHLQEALGLQPALAEAHSNLGLILLGQGKLEEAAGHYAAVLKQAPNDVTARNNLGYIALQRGSTSEAIQHYGAVAQVQPNDAQAHYNLGVAYIRANRGNEAAAELERVLQLAPGHVDARQELARMQRLPRP